MRSLLDRYGVLTREAVHAEGIVGGFGAVYEVLKAMEQAGRARRGYFVAGLGATQFALPGADDRLRAPRESDAFAVVLAATDPASPYGAASPWPEREGARPQRAAGAHVVLVSGALAGFLGRGDRNLVTFVPETEPSRAHVADALAKALAYRVDGGELRALWIGEIDGSPASTSPLAPSFAAHGFTPASGGLFKRSASGAAPGLHRKAT